MCYHLRTLETWNHPVFFLMEHKLLGLCHPRRSADLLKVTKALVNIRVIHLTWGSGPMNFGDAKPIGICLVHVPPHIFIFNPVSTALKIDSPGQLPL